MLTIEEWHGPFDKPRTMLTERDSDGAVTRRFDLTGLEYVQWTEDAMRKALLRATLDRHEALDKAVESVEIKERAGLSLEETVRAARLAEEARMKAWVDQANRDDHG